MENIRKYRALLHDNGVILSVAGIISQEMLVMFVQNLKTKIDSLLDLNPKAHNIFNIFIELVQNILNYSKSKDDDINEIIKRGSLILVGYDKKKELFYVSSSNLIDNADKEKLQERIEYVNSLDAEGLKSYYKEMRQQGKNKHEQGAGLGFIDMAKRSSQKLIYDFEKVDEHHQFFLLKVYA